MAVDRISSREERKQKHSTREERQWERIQVRKSRATVPQPPKAIIKQQVGTRINTITNAKRFADLMQWSLKHCTFRSTAFKYIKYHLRFVYLFYFKAGSIDFIILRSKNKPCFFWSHLCPCGSWSSHPCDWQGQGLDWQEQSPGSAHNLALLDAPDKTDSLKGKRCSPPTVETKRKDFNRLHNDIHHELIYIHINRYITAFLLILPCCPHLYS